MNVPHSLDELLDQVADGANVDWNAVEARATSREESAMLRNLRILAQLGQTHSSTIDEVVTQAPADIPASDGTVSDASSSWGRYRLIRRIGSGSFGTVYLAHDEELDREVALKLLHPGVARDGVKSEGRALARVDHPNVLTVYGVEEHDGRLALCMKYVRGRTLSDIVRSDGPMNADEAMAVAKAVCEAVAAVHAAGVLHRDIKARNVMRERNGRYVLMDFGAGVMQTLDGSAGRETSIGTPLYMAPEVLEGWPATRASDVYAIGVLLYFLVSGEYPVSSDTLVGLKSAHRRGARTPLDDWRSDLPRTFVHAVDRATAPNPVERPQSAAALLRELSASAPHGGHRRTLGQQMGRAVIAVALAAALVAALGLLNATHFDGMLERRSVASGSVADWFRWGVQSLIGPIFNLAQVLIAVFLLVTLARVIRRFWPAADRAWLRVADWLRQARLALGADNAESFAQLVIVAGVAYLGIVWWSQVDMITTLTTPISRLTPDQVQMLAPSESSAGYAFSPRSVQYRTLLDYAVLGIGWGLLRLLRLRRAATVRGSAAYVVVVAALLVLATVMWNAPYRAMFQAQRPRVTVDSQRCFNLGTAAGEMLVYCPDATPPKVRRMPVNDSRVLDTGITESVFATP